MGGYSRALRRELTESDWRKNTDEAVAVIDGWQYNNCDICLNPHKQGFSIGNMYAYVYTAQGHDSVWNFGENYNFGSCGGGCGVICPKEGYATEEAAREMGWRCLRNKASERLKDLEKWKDTPKKNNKGERETLAKLINRIDDMLMPTLF